MRTLEYVARTLAMLWALFWTSFFLAESLAWQTPLDRTAMWVALGLGFLALAVLAWRREVAGGVGLIAAGLLAASAYAAWAPSGLSVAVRVTTILAFGVPPVAAGALFLVHHRAAHSFAAKQRAPRPGSPRYGGRQST
jgi:hypothetical protein